MAWDVSDTKGRTDLASRISMAGREPLSVSLAVGAAKKRVNDMGSLLVTGEVTGFRGPNARSGHCYFQVKDESAAMDVIVWRGVYAGSGVELRDGMELELSGKFDVYAGSGRLSFVANKISVSGEGLLRQQVAQLRAKLEAEGLMAPARKRPIPRFCMRVAVVTSLSGSVIDDVKRTLRRRNPMVEILCAGCQVQGPGAPQSIIRALEVAAQAKPDAILLVRGGGSFEDLMTFNDEGLARAVASCPVPVITGIGHEPDNSICDDVSDRRTSTPTAAAESVAPALDEIVSQINARRDRMSLAMDSTLLRYRRGLEQVSLQLPRSISNRLERERLHLEGLASRRCLSDFRSVISDREASLMQSEQRLMDALPRSLERSSQDVEALGSRLADVAPRITRTHEAQVGRLAATLDALSPLKVLGRGYAIATDDKGHVLADVAELSVGSGVNVRLGSGSFSANVTEVRGQ